MPEVVVGLEEIQIYPVQPLQVATVVEVREHRLLRRIQAPQILVEVAVVVDISIPLGTTVPTVVPVWS